MTDRIVCLRHVAAGRPDRLNVYKRDNLLMAGLLRWPQLPGIPVKRIALSDAGIAALAAADAAQLLRAPAPLADILAGARANPFGEPA